MIKKIMLRLLGELLKDSKRSDRQLAKILKVSQPTVTRIRHKLEKKGLVRQFTIIPDFAALGYELMAISCVKTKRTPDTELMEKARKWWADYPNVIFVAEAQGMGKTGVLMSLHKSYSDYFNFISENRQHWQGDLEGYDTMLITLQEPAVKPLSFKYLAQGLEKQEN